MRKPLFFFTNFETPFNCLTRMRPRSLSVFPPQHAKSCFSGRDCQIFYQS